MKCWNELNILAPRNHDSGNMGTGIPERKPPLIGLITIHRKLSECQAQSRFAGCKPALHWRDFLYPTQLPIGFPITGQYGLRDRIIQDV